MRLSKIMFLSLAIGASLVTAVARAADMGVSVTKAPVAAASVCVPGNCSGWYAGFGLIGEGTNADIVGNGINGSVFAAGGAVEIHGGYQLWNGAFFAAVEGVAGYQFNNAIGGNVPAVHNSFRESVTGMELVKLGYNFFPSTQAALTAPAQSPVPLTVPANLLASTTPYLVFGGLQRRGVSKWTNGAGMTTVISSGWSSFAEYLYSPAQQGQNADQIVRIGLNKHF